MLKSSRIKLIHDSLANSGIFRSDDFRISQTIHIDDNNHQYNNVTIDYIYNDSYRMILTFSPSGTIFGEYCPGVNLLEESATFDHFGKLLSFLSTWTKSIEEELNAAPIIRQIQLHEERIKNLEEILNDVPNDYFTDNDIQDLVARIDQLETEFKSEMEKVVEDKNKLEMELAHLVEEFNTLKNNARVMTKKNWVKSLFLNAIKWTERHPDVVRQLAGIASQVLPNEIKQTIPQPLEEVGTLLLAAATNEIARKDDEKL